MSTASTRLHLALAQLESGIVDKGVALQELKAAVGEMEAEMEAEYKKAEAKYTRVIELQQRAIRMSALCRCGAKGSCNVCVADAAYERLNLSR